MPKDLTIPSDRSFGFTFVVVFGLVAAWQVWAGRIAVAYCFAGLGVATLIVTLWRPSLLNGLNRAWMKLGALLHRVINPVILGGIYFLVFTPFGVVMRLAGRDALRRRLEPTAQSYWINRDPPGPAPDSLPNQY